MATILKFILMFPIVYGIMKLNQIHLWSENMSEKFSKLRYYFIVLCIIVGVMILIGILKKANAPELGTMIAEAIFLGILASMVPYKNID